MIGNPTADGRSYPCTVQVSQPVRHAELLCQLPGQSRATVQLALIQDQCPVGVKNVPARTVGVLAGVCFSQAISFRNAPVFGQAVSRTPSTMVDVQRDGDVERGSIYASLAA